MKNQPTAGAFDFYHIFTSHMVLQQQKPIVFSGTADAGKSIQISFAGRTRLVSADARGVWQAEFPAMTAGMEPLTVVLSGAAGTADKILEDVLVGEVWMCSGQSNMQMPVWDDNDPYFRAEGGKEAMESADFPALRLFNSMAWRRTSHFEPLEDENGPGWEVCTPQSVETFSAVGFFFGRELLQDLDVPVGLIATPWGGTIIEAWISRDKFLQENCTELLKNRDWMAKCAAAPDDEESAKMIMKSFSEWLERFHACGKDQEELGKLYLQKDFDDSDWDSDPVSGRRQAVPGRKILRCTLDLPEELAGSGLELHLDAINDVDITFFNGTEVGRTSINQPDYWAFHRVYKVPAELVQKGRNVIAIAVDNHFSIGGLIPADAPRWAVSDARPDQKLPLEVWKGRTLWNASRDIGERPTTILSESNIPCTLFNGMMNPWFKYAVRGVIWYQGCSNNDKNYYALHRYLIDDWRTRWGDPEMPFLLVQLAGYRQNTPAERGDEDAWRTLPQPEECRFPIIREIQQLIARDVPNTGIAAAIDVGDQYNIHPADKKTPAHRLACEAKRLAYGKEIVSRGPEYDRFEIEGSAMRIFFKHTYSGLTTRDGKAPGAFFISGKDGILHRAEAVIEGDTVLVSSDQVSDPRRVRYAFCDYCGDCNLMNKEGFPALPFRTDVYDYSGEKVL